MRRFVEVDASPVEREYACAHRYLRGVTPDSEKHTICAGCGEEVSTKVERWEWVDWHADLWQGYVGERVVAEVSRSRRGGWDGRWIPSGMSSHAEFGTLGAALGYYR